MLLRVVSKVPTCVWICRWTIACWVSPLGWAGCAGGGRCWACLGGGFFLLVSTLMVGRVPEVLGAGCGCACGVSAAGGGVWAKPASQTQEIDTSAEPLRSSARTIRLDIPTPISCHVSCRVPWRPPEQTRSSTPLDDRYAIV